MMDDPAGRQRSTARPRRRATTAARTTIELSATNDAPALARRFAATAVRFLDCSVSHDDLALVVSEVVTNAVQLGDGSISVAVSATDDGGVRVEVRDDGFGMPQLQHSSLEQVTGRGLLIVDRVARSWGVHQFLPGKIVWFELDPS